ncbi:MAG: 16S rRNA (guanine(527)-N(7))-methyltransferase RsmG [Nitrospirae bacterium]|nr:MAG: 16S rRNA (guanine(527)-N(7))-methyltransferase RsmG [Nitrospirota bacterium]
MEEMGRIAKICRIKELLSLTFLMNSVFHVEHRVEQSVLRILREGATQLGWHLPQEILDAFTLYFDELITWNKKVNLIGLQDSTAIVVQLFLDSLAYGKAVFSESRPVHLLDVGSGAGFPGLPLRLFCPDLRVTLVEPNRKKVAFLHSLIGKLNVMDVAVLQTRIEEMSEAKEHCGRYSVVTVKALKSDQVLPYLPPLLRQPGHVILSRVQSPQKVEMWGFEITDEITYTLPFGYGARRLLRVSKKSP